MAETRRKGPLYCVALNPSQRAWLLMDRRWRMDCIGQLEKLCSRCMTWLPADSEFFQPRPHRPDGLDYWCRCCGIENKNKQSAPRAQLLALAA